MNTQHNTAGDGSGLRSTQIAGDSSALTPASRSKPLPNRNTHVLRGSTHHLPIIEPVSQSSDGSSNPVRHRAGRLVPASSPRHPRTREVESSSASPILVGDRRVLRALRAAEMAAWEAAQPSTRQMSSPTIEDESFRAIHPIAGRDCRSEAVLFLILAVSAAMGVFVGIDDLSNLLTQWSSLARGILRLLQ